jgi:hypothetical protein
MVFRTLQGFGTLVTTEENPVKAFEIKSNVGLFPGWGKLCGMLQMKFDDKNSH